MLVRTLVVPEEAACLKFQVPSRGRSLLSYAMPERHYLQSAGWESDEGSINHHDCSSSRMAFWQWLWWWWWYIPEW